jgi:tetratricopeptide (TPR) repeat protein
MARFRVSGKPAVEEALGLITKALEMQPNLASATYFRGVIAQETGDLKGAETLYQQVLELDKKHAEAQAALRRLRSQPKEKGGFFSKLFKGS